MKQARLIRDYVLKVHDESLKRLRARLSCTDPFEREAYKLLDDNYMDWLAALTDMTMAMLGHDTGEPEDARFDKTRRAVHKLLGKRPNGGADATQESGR